MAFIDVNLDMFPVEDIKVESLPSYAPERLNQETIRSANLLNPIILGEISPGRFNVIDGNHRAERARLEHQEKIQSRKISPKHHSLFLTSVKSYETYVRYWNEKVKEINRDERARKNDTQTPNRPKTFAF